MTPHSSPPSPRWADLRTRVLSAIVLIALAAIEIYLGGKIFVVSVAALVGVMIWELAVMARLTATLAVAMGALAFLGLMSWDHGSLGAWRPALLLLAPLALIGLAKTDRLLLAGYAVAVMVAGTGFLGLRAEGADLFLWLVLVVVASDSLGYFAGRMMGGPKFWPAISPKKTWSGTVAGWIGALLVGLGFALAGWPWALVWLSPLVGFAGQMGDIAESALKRRAGIKDSSRLIPGHGGVLDRFDALLGAVLALMIMRLLPIGAI